MSRIRNRQPHFFSSLPLWHRAARMISTNHYQAPVRRFILDLFDIPIDPETLSELMKHEQSSLKLITLPTNISQSPTSTDGHRKRSASSPGPKPIDIVERPDRMRSRGLTLSQLEGKEGLNKPRARPGGGFMGQSMFET